jgi:hypothetical protein
MPKRKKDVRFARIGEKDQWHPYGLQALRAEKFAYVANKILCGRFDLLSLRCQTTLTNRFAEH